MAKQLLPVGFYDLLFDEAEKNHENINVALAAFREDGYRLVKTPLIEFEDGFLDRSNNKFSATDIISGKKIIFRNDITLQIARLMATRLKQESLPIKLCYSGDVLCAKSDELYADRQQTQTGVEIIGCDAEKSDIEVVEILLSTLGKLVNKNILIEFSLPDLLEIFLDEIDVENSPELRDAIMKKNLSEIKKLANGQDDIIGKIALSNNDLDVLVAEIMSQCKSPRISEELQKAQKISEYLTHNFPEISLRFDLFGDHSSSYHSGISFDVFSGDFPYPIASGGRYKINNVNAVGATIYMNRLLKL